MAQRDGAFLAAVLDGQPGGSFVVDAVGTVLYASAPVAELVDLPVDELTGRNVLEFVDPETAWTYAAAVAMAGDYPGVVMGPLRITVVSAGGEVRSADLWATNHLDDPDIGGVVCVLTPASAAMGLSEALQGLAGGIGLEALAGRVCRAMGGHPVVGDAVLLSAGASGLRRVDDGVGWWPPGGDPDGPLVTSRAVTDAIATGVRQVHDDVAELEVELAAAARAAGFATVWVEPVGTAGPPSRGALVVWRRRPGRPSPNQVNLLHQAAAVLGLAWDRHDSLVG